MKRHFSDASEGCRIGAFNPGGSDGYHTGVCDGLRGSAGISPGRDS